MTIGKRLKEGRFIRGLTQAQLGQKIGLSFNNASATINQYEAGKHEPKYAVMKQIANALELPVMFFYAPTTKQGMKILKIFVKPRHQQPEE